MAQQTALSWLKDMLEWNYGDPKMLEISWENLDDLLERAKQIEKEQMFEFTKKHHIIGEHSTKFYTEEFEQYYNETYNK